MRLWMSGLCVLVKLYVNCRNLNSCTWLPNCIPHSSGAVVLLSLWLLVKTLSIFYLFIWKAELEGVEVSGLSVGSLFKCPQLPKLRVWSCRWRRDPSGRVHFHCLPRHVSRELHGRWSGGASNPSLKGAPPLWFWSFPFVKVGRYCINCIALQDS